MGLPEAPNGRTPFGVRPFEVRVGSADERAQHVLQDAAVAVVVGLTGGVDADDGVELDSEPSSAVTVTVTVFGMPPSLSASTPVIEKVSVPVRPSDSAFWPAGNCSGSTPMPIRLERWMRS